MGLIDAIGQIAGGWITNSGQKKQSKLEWRRNQRQWKQELIYNSPEKQMERYQDAGLNPMLIYGNGTASAGNTTVSAPEYHAPRLENPARGINLPNALEVVQAITNFKNFQKDQQVKDSVIEKNKQEADFTFAKSLTEDIRRIYLGILSGKEKTNAHVSAGIADTQIEMVKQKLRNAVLDQYSKQNNLKLFPYQMESYDLRNQLLRQKKSIFPEELRNLKTRNDLLGVQLDINKSLAPYGLSGKDSGFWKTYSRGANTVEDAIKAIIDALINNYENQ